MLGFLSSYGALASLSLVGGMLVLLLVGIVTIAAKDKRKDRQADGKDTDISMKAVKDSFFKAVQHIEASLVSRHDRHEIPWVMVLDEPENSFDIPLEEAGCSSLISDEIRKELSTSGLQWHVLEQGVVAEINTFTKGSETEGVLATFLQAAQKYRPERPIDSVVVGLPIELLESDRPEDLEELKARAQKYYRLIRGCESALGMRLAVYVVITGLEQWPGSSPLVEDLPIGFRDSILGWSNPSDVGSHFATNLVNPAMQGIAGSLLSILIEQSVDAGAPRNYLPKLLVARRLKKLYPSVSLFLQEFLRPNSQDEAFFFRGFYFTFGCESHAKGEATVVGFLRELFEQKIFQERGVTRSNQALIEQRKIKRSRALAWTVGVAAVYCVVVAFELFKLSVNVKEWEETAASLGNTIDASSDESLRYEIEQASQLLDATNSNRFWAFSIPISWPTFSSALDEIGDTTFKRYLVPTFLYSAFEFDENARRIGLDSGSRQSTLFPSLTCRGDIPLENTARAIVTDTDNLLIELVDLRKELDEIYRVAEGSEISPASLKPLIARHNLRLPSFDYSSVVSLGEFGELASSEFLGSRSVLIDQIARCRFDRIMRSTEVILATRPSILETEIEVERALDSLITRINDSASSRFEVIDGYDGLISAIESQNNLIREFNDLETNLESFGSDIGARIDEAARLGFVDPDLQDQMSSSIARLVVRLGADKGTRYAGQAIPFVSIDDKGNLSPSPDRLRLLGDLKKARSDPKNSADLRGWRVGEVDGLARWDQIRVTQLVSSLKGRLSANEPVGDLPDSLTQAIDSRKKNLAVTEFMVGLDPVLIPTGSLSENDYAQFSDAAAVLSQASSQLYESGFRYASSAVDSLVSDMANEYLGQVNRDISRLRPLDAVEKFVGPENYEGSVTLNSGTSDDNGDLSSYLDRQVKALRKLRERADFILPYVDSESSRAAWAPVAEGLDAFDRLDPRSGLKLLYQLTERGLVGTATTCVESLKGIQKISPVDSFFGSRFISLRADLSNKCQRMAERLVATNWASFSKYFEDQLDGKAPFMSRDDRGAATIDEIMVGRDLFSSYYDAINKAGPSATMSKGFIDDWLTLMDSLEQMKLDDNNFGVILKAEFRTDKENERFANQLIDYSVSLPSGVLHEGQNKPVLWKLGDPLTLSLKLASDSVFEFADDESTKVTGNAKLYVKTYEGLWALQKALRYHAVESKSDKFGSTFNLVLPFKLTDTANQGPTPINGSLSVRLQISADKTGAPVNFPFKKFAMLPASDALSSTTNNISQR